jgi:hypothetical protein
MATRGATTTQLKAWFGGRSPFLLFDCLFARYARTLGVQLGEAWHSLHPDGRIAMAIYTPIGAGDQGGRQSFVDALARAKCWQERPMLLETVNSLSA